MVLQRTPATGHAYVHRQRDQWQFPAFCPASRSCARRLIVILTTVQPTRAIQRLGKQLTQPFTLASGKAVRRASH